MNDERYLSAEEAAARLDITRATLYAYVSRGLIRSEPADKSKRRHRYRADDVRRLQRRKEQRRNPALAAEEALHFGAPVLESSITLIDNGRLYYRGQEAVKLAASRSLEEVASFIWTGDWQPGLFTEDRIPTPPQYEEMEAYRSDLPAVARFQLLLPTLESVDYAAFDLRPEAVLQRGVHIMRLFAFVAAGGEVVNGKIVATLQRGLNLPGEDKAGLLRAALILTADHELNVSSFTARCVASAGATPYQVVLAGLAALQGARHGGYTERAVALLEDVARPQEARATLGARLRRGEVIPGFGHPLYPQGDPRAAYLLRQLKETLPTSPHLALAEAVSEAAQQLLGQRPTIDFALAALARVLQLADDGALMLFALGRTVGWIGQALEQYESGQMIRPRARYGGPLPDED